MSNITDKDITDLQKQIDAKKRQAEYNKLKNELNEMAKQPTEFDSGMTYPDTDKILQSSKKKHFINILFERVGHMLSPRSATGNFIALGIIIAVLVVLRANIVTQINGYDISKYIPYISYLALVAGVLQILKSSTRSLIIPLIATVIGGFIATSMNAQDLVFTFGQSIYQGMFIAGLVGLIFGAFAID